MGNAFVFPGQGSQHVGMGAALADASVHAREVFEEVDDALGERLSRLMRDGPEEALTLTANAQPAIMALSMAVVRVLEREGGIRLADKALVAAGHSLGEYSALCAAGSLSLADAARLLRRRGEAMQAAVPPGEGAMAALLGLDHAAAAAVAAEAAASGGDGGEVCVAANDNAPGQVVVSGHRAAVERAVELAKARGARRAMMLNVSAPFHCSLMAPAADAMREALAAADIRAPFVPLVANVSAAVVTAPDDIRAALVDQVTGAVRWRESVEAMGAMGATRFVEPGAKVVGAMVKRILPDAANMGLATMADIEAAAAAL